VKNRGNLREKRNSCWFSQFTWKSWSQWAHQGLTKQTANSKVFCSSPVDVQSQPQFPSMGFYGRIVWESGRRYFFFKQ
jgi:hypothetical protein